MPTIAVALILAAAVDVKSQHLEVVLEPGGHTAIVDARLELAGEGPLLLELTEQAEIDRVELDGRETPYRRARGESAAADRIELSVPDGARRLVLTYHARFEQDAAAGERPGQIHNFSVDAHIGEDGVFLSEGSAWHPRPIAEDGRPRLHRISVNVAPIEAWAIVASGNPVDQGALTDPRWQWATPRPVDGVSIVGNRHALHGQVHATPHGPVEIVMHVTEEHEDLAPLFINAAGAYLDLYVPLLGPFPYQRFSIVENFFSSGFAYPGFTVLGPQVVGMAPRSLAPGYLDHELVHNWWGNGVYVDPRDGNWCEALTSYCANYHRRVAEGGPDAGRAYRRGLLMKLSSDPLNLDDGPLGQFGVADSRSATPNRFVGYDKGSFVFFMLQDVLASNLDAEPPDDSMWESLRRFARLHLGERADWADLQAAFEAQVPNREPGWLDGYFQRWVRQHTVPRTIPGERREAPQDFARQFDSSGAQPVAIAFAPDRQWCEIDPDFRLYRILPPDQIVPTIAGTLGKGGTMVEIDQTRPEATAYLRQMPSDPAGENLLLIGAGAAGAHAELLARSADPCSIDSGSFTVGGTTYDQRGQALLHTMQHPDRPGHFITVFHSNGDAGWSQLRVIRFYSRDTTIVWDDGQVIDRRVHEPDRRIELTPESGR